MLGFAIFFASLLPTLRIRDGEVLPSDTSLCMLSFRPRPRRPAVWQQDATRLGQHQSYPLPFISAVLKFLCLFLFIHIN